MNREGTVTSDMNRESCGWKVWLC